MMNHGKIEGPTIRVSSGNHAELLIAAVVDAELPGFWAFLKDRHPEFKGHGGPSEAPIGYLHAFQVYNAMAETLPIYIAHLRAGGDPG